VQEDAFAVRGMHVADGNVTVRYFDPRATAVTLIDERDGSSHAMPAASPGMYELRIGGAAAFPYRLRVQTAEGETTGRDPYSFGPVLSEFDAHLIAEGSHQRLWEKLGANAGVHEDESGFVFAVWAPNAKRVSVVGDFNGWDGRVHPMRFRVECGVWEIFLPGLGAGEHYKFELEDAGGRLLPLKADPLARAAEMRPRTASVLCAPSRYRWNDDGWMSGRAAHNPRRTPMLTYEVHLGSWRRTLENAFLSYADFADQLVGYAKDMGFTHLELMPVMEHPFDTSWGYQTTGMFAPTSRFGTPDEFKLLVDRAHQAGLGVILDWVPGHFPADAFGLARFDGTALYEYADPRKGYHPDWHTYIYNFGRLEVTNFLIASALFWLDEYHVDGFRVDAVASMLFLSYSRKPGEWEPNKFGGPENLEAVDFIRRFNELSYAGFPGIITVAEESTEWPRVSAPVYLGGLGFGFKWNMGWMHDMLQYFAYDPLYRRFHHENLTFGIMYAWTENFVLPLSHDEVVHGKGSLLQKMPGDPWQQFANLRMLYGFMYAYPGKKLLFMGDEFAQWNEWTYFRSLDWHLMEDPMHAGTARLVRDLNLVLRDTAALYEADHEPGGFGWIDHRDRDQSIIAFLRRDGAGVVGAIALVNATPVVRHGYRIGAPKGGWREAINTDQDVYGGSGVCNGLPWQTDPIPMHGFADSLSLTLPPLSTLILVPAQ
jgi:1,4-alpha-glucan branching enzyme